YYQNGLHKHHLSFLNAHIQVCFYIDLNNLAQFLFGWTPSFTLPPLYSSFSLQTKCFFVKTYDFTNYTLAKTCWQMHSLRLCERGFYSSYPCVHCQASYSNLHSRKLSYLP